MTVNRLMRRAALLALPLALVACDPNDWLTDMQQQPSVGTWQKFSSDSLLGETTPFRGMPQGSVPVTGVTLASWEVSYAALPGTLDSMSYLENPVPADARSLENGRKHYQINCAVCHGIAADAQTPLREVNVVMGSLTPSLLAPAAVNRTDGYYWGIIRNGRGMMASVNRIPEQERWDVINYIRGLQGRYEVNRSPVGFPGQTGSALPGYSVLGPTVPSVHVRPSTEGVTELPENAHHDGGHE